jgi:hypothetical protein
MRAVSRSEIQKYQNSSFSLQTTAYLERGAVFILCCFMEPLTFLCTSHDSVATAGLLTVR